MRRRARQPRGGRLTTGAAPQRTQGSAPPGREQCRCGTLGPVPDANLLGERSCYPWPVLGLPPSWYKDPAYRARVVKEPRAVLAEWGTDLGPDVEVRVHDSSSEVRYLVLPGRPPGTESMSEEELAALVTRDAMVGVRKVAAP
ncbi:nitrile hydratase subunit alpha [Geodermatophilus obscurus]|uniref:nitrile hydratase subunit alpha n=1 Tax=Geodermatophilus obscurus TaxID=1861 RepID=UPI0009D7736E|nr:nitrile hydratase subunit alpha [Geodermatophilus obscurus]